MKKLLASLLIAGAATQPVSADLFANYLTGTAVKTDFAGSAIAGATDLGIVGFSPATHLQNTLDGVTIGDGHWFHTRTYNTSDEATSDVNYLGFSVAASGLHSSGLANAFAFESLTFKMQMFQGDFTSTLQLYANIDGGGFKAVGSPIVNASPTNPVADQFYDVGTVTVDLSAYGDVETAEFRLGVADNQDWVTRSTIIQDIQLNGTMVPEPSSTALLGLGMLALITRRSRKLSV